MRHLAITVREVTSMLREKSFLLMILMELLLVSSSGLLSVGYVILTSPESSSTLSQLSNLVYVGVVTNTRLSFSQALDDSKVHHAFYDSFSQAHSDFKDGLLDAVLVGDLTQDDSPSIVTVYLPSNSPKAPLTKMALKKALLKLEDNMRVRRVEKYSPNLQFATYKIMNYKPQARYVEIYFIFTLPILLFLPCIVSGSLVIDSITQDLESKRIINLIAAPISDAHIVIGKSLGSLVLSVFQTFLWLIILSFTFINPENPAALIVLCGLYTVIFMNLGSLLALYIRKMKASQILYTFVSMSAISLFSPFANVHPMLLEISPAYMITRMALGTSPLEFAWQFLTLILAVVLSTVAVIKASREISRHGQ
jgi:ABC-2 type transport system permease protein